MKDYYMVVTQIGSEGLVLVEQKPQLILGRYVVPVPDKPMGSGSFCNVFYAHAEGDTRDEVVVRRLNRSSRNYRPNSEDYFQNGIRTHRAVDQYQDVIAGQRRFPRFLGETEDGYVMEFINGLPLSDRRILSRTATSNETALIVAYQLAQALDTFHRVPVDGRAVRKPMTHADVKPENVMISWNGRLNLLDFDLAVNGNEPEQNPDEFLATPTYMSPGHVSGNLTQPSDLFSYGSVVYRMTHGVKPFEGKDQAFIQAALSASPMLTLLVNPVRSAGYLGEAIKRCWGIGPIENLYGSSSELRKELESELADEGIKPEEVEDRLSKILD